MDFLFNFASVIAIRIFEVCVHDMCECSCVRVSVLICLFVSVWTFVSLLMRVWACLFVFMCEPMCESVCKSC